MMGEYVYTIVCAAVCTAVIICLSPDGEGGSIGKYVAFAGAIVMALTMLSPLSELLQGISGYKFDLDTGLEAEVAGKEGEYYAESAGTVLSSLYGMDRSKISARITEGEGGELLKITLIVNECDFNKEEASGLLSEIYDITVEIEEDP